MSRVAIVGAGLSGLVAAHDLRRLLGADSAIDLYDSADRVGGLLHGVDVAGRTTDVGAEAFVLRRPEAHDLVVELGLADELVVPTGARPAVWAGGRRHRLPAPAWMGIPASAEAVRGLADDADVARMESEPTRPLHWTRGSDCSLGELVADRFGPSVVARSVDPMIGGVYACLAADTGVRAAMPALAARLDDGAPSLTAAVEALLPPAGAEQPPVFGALRGGYGRLVAALVESGAPTLNLNTPVGPIARIAGVWAVGAETYDAVVVATPAPVAATQLEQIAPASAESLAQIETASSAVVALAVDASVPVPDLSGVLAATGDELARGVCANPAKAITLSSRKWPHYRDSAALRMRVSFGRLGEPVIASDEELVTAAVAAVGQVCGEEIGERLIDAAVQHWPGGLPCYAPGHQARARAVIDGLPPGIVVAGSAYNGVGVPACIAQARSAAAAVDARIAAR
ncbi:protoporphyrinogen oxidase [Gordonia araii NBRC 100433]|uniref:Protoporphyrinogen oxidase n=1 Tax=Gordonia araii NBRC 100433 TaxID=1073574 RepID=G7H5I7_9ACTN|nr:FAD-dependent oxidoreductase [Gordonia araii]NNG95825.1 NAD(P)-binding protein [Gordonia araii NBRC 100433]GAB11112.1 protoporphyrinogen oxidase [Gordonia araii NBRC 100433]